MIGARPPTTQAEGEPEPGGRPGGIARLREMDRDRLRVLLAGRGLLGRVTYLAATQVVTVVLGFAYWTVTARLVPAHQIGVAAAATSTALLLSMLGVLGATTIMLVALGSLDEADQRALVTTGLIAASLTVLLLALGAWALSPFLGPSLRRLGENPLDGLLFLVGAVETACGSVLDAASIGLRRGMAQLARNAIASVLKVMLVLVVVVASARTTTGLLVVWDLALGVSILFSPRLLRLRLGRVRIGMAHRLEILRRFTSLALAHHVLNLAIAAVTYFLPVIAALIVAPREMAYFSIAQLVSSSVLVLPFFFATSLFVESTGDEAALRDNVRKTFPIGLGACAILVAIFEPAARMVLSVFGPAYQSNGAIALHLLLLGGFGYVVKDHFMAIRRAQNRLGEAARIGVVTTTVELVGAAIGGLLGGLGGLCAGWVLATVVDACLLFPAVWVTLYSRGAHSPAGHDAAPGAEDGSPGDRWDAALPEVPERERGGALDIPGRPADH